MVVLAVIPARGGSKAIPGKNLAMAAGRSLLAWTADAARASRTLTRIVLSTDDDAIAEAGRRLGVEVPFMRPAGLAQDETPILPVLQHLVGALEAADGFRPDAVVLLQPTSPMRRAEHIDGAVDLLLSTGADSVVSVVPLPHQFSPVSVMREVEGRLVPYLDASTVLRRQDKPMLYARNGPAVLAVRRHILGQDNLYGHDVRPFVMTLDDSIDIDSPPDLELADWLLRKRLGN
jgi:CMP-N-acetylneuraminic acid synthetase